MIDLEKYFADGNYRFVKNAMLSTYTTFKTGGPADYVVFPDTEEKLVDLIRIFNSESVRYFVLGKGSNILATDDGYRGVVINTCEIKDIRLIDECTLECSCGLPLILACRFALENSLTGLEFAYGIPGTVGGAVFMNAGAYGGEMKDVILSVRHITSDGRIETLSNDELELSYRKSIYSDNNCVVLSVILRLSKSDSAEIKSKMDDLMQKRKDKQPIEFPSAGSTFKRPLGYFAGALIQECGLMGYSVGGAMISTKHAGFVINYNNAKSDDILSLVKHCQDVVYSQKGVKLETEIRLLK